MCKILENDAITPPPEINNQVNFEDKLEDFRYIIFESPKQTIDKFADYLIKEVRKLHKNNASIFFYNNATFNYGIYKSNSLAGIIKQQSASHTIVRMVCNIAACYATIENEDPEFQPRNSFWYTNYPNTPFRENWLRIFNLKFNEYMNLANSLRTESSYKSYIVKDLDIDNPDIATINAFLDKANDDDVTDIVISDKNGFRLNPASGVNIKTKTIGELAKKIIGNKNALFWLKHVFEEQK